MTKPLTISAGWGGNVVAAAIVPDSAIHWGFNEFVNWLAHCGSAVTRATVAGIANPREVPHEISPHDAAYH